MTNVNKKQATAKSFDRQAFDHCCNEELWNHLVEQEKHDGKSNITMDNTNESTQLVASINLQKIKEVIEALIDGGSNDRNGDEYMTFIGFILSRRKSMPELQKNWLILPQQKHSR